VCSKSVAREAPRIRARVVLTVNAVAACGFHAAGYRGRMWWQQKLGTHVALLLVAIANTVGLFLVRGSVNVWFLPLLWAAIIASIGLIRWWLWFLFHY
jgi:hypothetical protein